jgi:hypothetical protein
MEIIDANKRLIGDVCLYAMKGFFLLVAQFDYSQEKFKNAFIGNEIVILISVQEAVIININKNVSDILKQQMQLISNKPNVMGVLTQIFEEDLDMETVDFLPYRPIEALGEFVTNDQKDSIMKHCEVNENEKV